MALNWLINGHRTKMGTETLICLSTLSGADANDKLMGHTSTHIATLEYRPNAARYFCSMLKNS